MPSLRSIAIRVFYLPTLPKPKPKLIRMVLDFIGQLTLSLSVIVAGVFMFIPEAPPFSGNTLWDIVFWLAAMMASAVAILLKDIIKEFGADIIDTIRYKRKRRQQRRAALPGQSKTGKFRRML
jgi:hypothetical protein